MPRIPLALALLSTVALAGCPGAECPAGEVAVAGACYDRLAVAAVDGGVPILCTMGCGGATPYCDYATGTCIACRVDVECTTPDAPRCDPLAHECVGCTGGSSCARFDDAPNCDLDEGRCTACATPCDGATPFCDESSGTCIACRTNADCGSADASRCDPSSHTCSACVDNTSCSRFVGKGNCDVTDGRCVGCSVALEATVCGGNSCDALLGQCTSTPTHSRTPCQTCRADSECALGQNCVAYSWSGTPAENVCLWNATVAPCAANAFAATAPYVRQNNASITIHGATVQACEPPSACAAVIGYLEGRTCSVTSDCGAPPSSASCRDGKCAMGCFSFPVDYVGYRGCLSTDVCDNNIWCVAP